MKSRTAIFFLAALLPCAGPANGAARKLSRAQQKKFVASALRYLRLRFRPDGKEQRADLLEELRPLEASSWKGLRKAFRPPYAKPFLRAAGKTGKQTLHFPPPGLASCEYLIDLPRGYTPARPWPLVVLLHGGGKNQGNGSQIMSLMGPAFQKRRCIVVAPTCPPDCWWHSPRTETFLQSILFEVSATYAVDFDRIYAAGHSFGGVGAWSVGTRFPDLFAGFAPAAGNPPNVMDYDLFHNTAFYVAHGRNDTRVVPDGDLAARKAVEALDPKPRHYRFDFFEAGDALGHGLPHDKIEAMAAFLTRWKRDPFPERAVCVAPFAQVKEGVRDSFHAFWLGVDERPVYQGHGKAVGELAGDNLIRIRTTHVTRISVYVSDDFLDLDKPVRIEINGRIAFEKRVERSVEFLLEHMEKTGDRGRVFANRIRLP